MRALRNTVLVLAAVPMLLAGCANPSYLTNSYNDWHNQLYAENPGATAVFTNIIPAASIPYFVTVPVDYMILNPIQFWVDTVRGEGVGYVHDNVQSPKDPWFSERSLDATTTAP